MHFNPITSHLSILWQSLLLPVLDCCSTTQPSASLRPHPPPSLSPSSSHQRTFPRWKMTEDTGPLRVESELLTQHKCWHWKVPLLNQEPLPTDDSWAEGLLPGVSPNPWSPVSPALPGLGFPTHGKRNDNKGKLWLLPSCHHVGVNWSTSQCCEISYYLLYSEKKGLRRPVKHSGMQ